jgi:hypothetical protein
LVVKNALKTCSACFGSSPAPVSPTEISSLPRPDCQFSSSTRVLYGFDAIEHEVHPYLQQLHPVGHGLGKITGKSAADRNRMPARLTAQQDNHFSNEFIYTNQLLLQPTLLEPQADSANAASPIYANSGYSPPVITGGSARIFAAIFPEVLLLLGIPWAGILWAR